MKPKTRFLKMYLKLPKEARNELVYDFAVNPMTLTICMIEIQKDTELGKKILYMLGYR